MTGHEVRTLHKGGVKDDDQEDHQEDSNDLQVQEFLLTRRKKKRAD